VLCPDVIGDIGAPCGDPAGDAVEGAPPIICASGEACGAFIVLPEVGEGEVKGAATAPKANLSLSLCALISFKLLS
jgi:hypothetical protein